MSKGLFEGAESLLPIDFFNIEIEATLGKKLLLPDTSELLGEEPFAQVSLTVAAEGIRVYAHIDKPFEECFYPDFERGDCMELFIDTRDLKNVGFMTRFCHHFLIMPTEVQGISSREITRFRTEDVHPLCDPSDLDVKVKFASKHYVMDVLLPAHCLHGFDLGACNHLGFTYRINRPKGDPQHFALSSLYYNIAQHPSLWSTIQIQK